MSMHLASSTPDALPRLRNPSGGGVSWLIAALVAVNLAGCGGASSDAQAVRDPAVADIDPSPVASPDLPGEPVAPEAPSAPPATSPLDPLPPATEGAGSPPASVEPAAPEPDANPPSGPIEPSTPDDPSDVAAPGPEAPVDASPPPEGARLPELLPDRSRVFGEPVASFPDPNSVTGIDRLAWVYDLVGDQLVAAGFEAPEVHQRLWRRFAELVPADLRPSLVDVEFYVPAQDDAFAPYAQVVSHGYGEVPGEERTLLSLGESFNVDFVEAVDAGYGTHAADAVFVHEFGHLLQNRDGVTAGANDPVFAHYYGLNYRRTSPFGSFLEAFWEGEAGAFNAARQGAPDVARIVHERYPAEFVSEYAASNAWEDFAETFLAFVETPPGNEGADGPGADKLAWFARWPEGVAIRERLRASL